MRYSLVIFFGLFWLVARGQLPAPAVPLGPAGPAERVSFEHYSQEKGLSQGTGYAIAQFDDYMWFATQDGLNRFDGYEFEVFRPGGKQDLNNSIVQALLVDARGQFWVGTGGGLNLYDKATGRFEQFSKVARTGHALDSVSVKKLIADRRGNIWVVTDEKGLFSFNTATHKITPYFPDDNSVTGSCIDANGDLWIATYHAIYQYNPVTCRFGLVITQRQLATKSLLGNILFDKQGKLWIGTREDGVFVMNPDPGHRVVHYQAGRTTKHLSSPEITALLQDRAGRIWIGSRNGGIAVFDPVSQTFSHLSHSRNDARSLAENSIWSLFEDQHGIVWVGFGSQGIDKYDPNQFPFQLIQRDPDNPAHSLPDNMIFRLFGRGDDLFIGTRAGGLAQYSRAINRVTHVLSRPPSASREPDNIISNEVRVIVADADKKLWLANWRGLIHYDPVRHTVRTYKSVDKREQLYVYAAHLLTDSSGRTREVWTGGEAGLARFDAGTKQWRSWDGIPAMKAIATHQIRLMYADGQQNLWLGTLGHGLIRYDVNTQKTTRFDAKNGLACANIRSMLADGRTLWVGTDCGLFGIDLVDLRVTRHVSDQAGAPSFRLPNNVIYSILKDNQGLLWLSSNRGLTRFSPTKGVLKNYDLNDGLQSDEFNTNVCYRHSDGTLFFGGINGINYFRPDEFRRNTLAPPVRITGVTVLDSAYGPNRSRLTLTHNQNFIEFKFASLNFSNTRKNQYQYKLEGIDPQWVDARHRRVANYTKLPPGDYVFRVKGSNDDGVWNEQGAAVSIVITPPFWATWWFRVVLIALLVSGLYGVYRYRVAQLKSRQAHELTVAVRTQELERQRFAKELHDGVGANLAVLKMYLTTLGSPTVPVDDLKARSLAVLKSSIEDIRGIIHDLHPRSLSELGLEQTITDLVAVINESHHLMVTFEPQNVPQKLPESIEVNLFRVVQELLQNALKHANARSVWLRLYYEPDILRLTYRDDGRGFTLPPAGRPSGNGLVNINQRIALMKGTHKLNSVGNQGTTVEISVPTAV